MYVRISTSNTNLQKCKPLPQQKCKPLPQPHRKTHCNKNLKCFPSNHLVSQIACLFSFYGTRTVPDEQNAV